MTDEYQSMAANAICNAAAMAGDAWMVAGNEAARPSTLYRPQFEIKVEEAEKP